VFGSRALVLAALVAAGCRSSSSNGSRTVTVSAFAGDTAEPGVTVVSSAPDGTIVDETVADAVGRAAIGADDDSLVSVIFPGTITEITPAISVVSVAVAADAMSVDGPGHGPAPLLVGGLQVDGANLNTAAYFDVQIGCATVRVTKLPAAIDVGACSMGTDTSLDVLVAGYHDAGTPPAPVLDGYAAGRVAMVNGLATYTATQWLTTTTSVPVTLDGVMPSLQLELLSDGLSFGGQPVTDHGTAWTGLVVDASRITATLPGTASARVTTRNVAGVPASISFTANDFLAPVALSTAIAHLAPTLVTWAPAAVGDAVNLHATWEIDPALRGAPAVPIGPHRVIWDAVLPPDAAGATLPLLDGDLGTAVEPQSIDPANLVLRYVESPTHDGFAALLAAGVHAENTDGPSTIVPRPASGDLRVSETLGAVP
jgi:hypothetical protein